MTEDFLNDDLVAEMDSTDTFPAGLLPKLYVFRFKPKHFMD